MYRIRTSPYAARRDAGTSPVAAESGDLHHLPLSRKSLSRKTSVEDVPDILSTLETIAGRSSAANSPIYPSDEESVDIPGMTTSPTASRHSLNSMIPDGRARSQSSDILPRRSNTGQSLDHPVIGEWSVSSGHSPLIGSRKSSSHRMHEPNAAVDGITTQAFAGPTLHSFYNDDDDASSLQANANTQDGSRGRSPAPIRFAPRGRRKPLATCTMSSGTGPRSIASLSPRAPSALARSDTFASLYQAVAQQPSPSRDWPVAQVSSCASVQSTPQASATVLPQDHAIRCGSAFSLDSTEDSARWSRLKQTTQKLTASLRRLSRGLSRSPTSSKPPSVLGKEIRVLHQPYPYESVVLPPAPPTQADTTRDRTHVTGNTTRNEDERQVITISYTPEQSPVSSTAPSVFGTLAVDTDGAPCTADSVLGPGSSLYQRRMSRLAAIDFSQSASPSLPRSAGADNEEDDTEFESASAISDTSASDDGSDT